MKLGAGGGLQLGTNSSNSGLQLGSSGGLKPGAGSGLQLGTNSSTSGLQLGSSGGLKSGAGSGLQLGTNSSTSGLQLGSGGGLKSGLGSGLQLGTNSSTSGLQLGSSGGLKSGTGSGLQLGTNSSTSELQLGSSGGLKLGVGSGLQLGTGGGLQLGTQVSSSNTIKVTSGEESAAATNNLGRMKLPLVGQKRSFDESGSSSIDKPDTSLLSKPSSTLPKTVTFKLDGNNKNDIFSGNKQSSSGLLGSTVGVIQPILGGLSNQPQVTTSENSSVNKQQPLVNFFQQPSTTTSSSLATFQFSGVKSTSTTSSTSTTQTFPAPSANLLNFTQGAQQSIFASSQGQPSTFGAGLGKILNKSESSGNTTLPFFSGASKNNESSQG